MVVSDISSVEEYGALCFIFW